VNPMPAEMAQVSIPQGLAPLSVRLNLTVLFAQGVPYQWTRTRGDSSGEGVVDLVG